MDSVDRLAAKLTELYSSRFRVTPARNWGAFQFTCVDCGKSCKLAVMPFAHLERAGRWAEVPDKFSWKLDAHGCGVARG